MPGGWEIWVVVAIILLLFGAPAIPKLARNMGKAKGEFERGMKEGAKAASEAGGDESEAKKDD